MIEYTRHIRVIDTPYLQVGYEPLFYGIAYLVFFWFLYKKSKLFNFKQLLIFTGGFVLFGSLFGRLFYFMIPWKGFDFFLKFFYTPYSVINSLGGIVGVGLFTLYYIKKRKVNSWKLLETLVLGAPIMLVLMRIGCFINGHIKGLETSVPWCIISFGACRHPVALYYIILNIGLWLLLHNYSKNKHHHPREILIIFCLTYTFARMILDYFFLNSKTMTYIFVIVFGCTIVLTILRKTLLKNKTKL